MIASDDFADDWYGWLTNQCGHIVLGLGASVLMLWADWWTPVIAAVAYWLLVEGIAQNWKMWQDGVMDTFFVMAGASVLLAYEMGAITLIGVAVVTGAMLGGGAWKRY